MTEYKSFTDKAAPRLFYAVLLERNIDSDAASSLMDVAAFSTQFGAIHLYAPYQRTDMARNTYVRVFLRESKRDDDVLVMMDNDHLFPRDVVVRLASQVDAEHEVIGALAFRRSAPYDPVMYRFNERGESDIPTAFTGGLMPADIMGTGTIAIRRSVFKKLDDIGVVWPYFRYFYQDGAEIQRSEDWDFCLALGRAGVKVFCDTSFFIPHITKRTIGPEDWFKTLKDAQEAERNGKSDQLDPVHSRLGLRFSFGGNGNGANGNKPEPVASHG